ncbi:MAG: CvpA family protein [Clostridia bacterium]|nr:CvpA family protein [Clostridia bacterium]
MLNIIVDCILVLIIAIGLFLGIKRGFVKTIAKPVKIILTFVIAFSFASPLSKTFVEPRMREPIANQMEEYILENCEGISAENINEELPTVLKIGASLFDIDINELASGEESASIVNKITESLISPAIHVVSTIITFIILLLVSGIALSIIIWILNSIVDVGVVGVFNRILGAIFSTAFAFIIAWGLTSVFTYVINLPSVAASEWASGFKGGFVYKLFNSINPIELLLSF